MNNYTIHDTLLSIKDVSLSYGDKVILNGVNAEVKDIEREGMTQGQVVCFLGPSGIGKSQLARCIAGLQSPTSGSITIGAGSTPTSAGLVGLVQQSYPLFGYMTASQNLITAVRMSGLPLTQGISKAGQLAEMLGLSQETLQQYPKQLSGGQRQRVAIIRQLLCSEHLLILDEPFSGLDVIAKAKACKLISDVAAMDTLNTIIVITHDVTEGMSIADKVWLMGKQGAGATITDTFDLAELGLAWQPDILDNPRFQELVLLVKHRFLEAA
jgi:polar amino acid transport system ATP-binding protein/sulfate transport system ATP-binding protein